MDTQIMDTPPNEVSPNAIGFVYVSCLSKSPNSSKLSPSAFNFIKSDELPLHPMRNLIKIVANRRALFRTLRHNDLASC